MLRFRLVFPIVLLCVLPSLLFGAEKDERISASETGQKADGDAGVEEDSVKSTYMNDKIQFTVNAGMGLSAYQWHFTGGLQVDFNANPVLGIGLKTTVDYGIKYDNLNINAYLLYKIWWFYLGPGVSFIVKDMNVPANDPKYAGVYKYPEIASLAVTAGFRFPFVRLGPGHLTMDLSVDWYQTDIPLSVPNPPLSGQLIEELVNGSTYAFKIGARLGYTF